MASSGVVAYVHIEAGRDVSIPIDSCGRPHRGARIRAPQEPGEVRP